MPAGPARPICAGLCRLSSTNVTLVWDRMSVKVTVGAFGRPAARAAVCSSVSCDVKFEAELVHATDAATGDAE